MKYIWEDLPERKNCFTVRNAVMRNLNTGEIVRHYAANTKIAVVQKCVTPEKTYYRTYEAAHHYLNYAFEASAFGLPNEKAPSVPKHTPNNSQPSSRTPLSVKKQKPSQKVASSKDGEKRSYKKWFKRILWRKNG